MSPPYTKMLTQTVAGRTYDYSHAVGGQHIGRPVSLAVADEDAVYSLERPSENISDVPWNRTASGARISVCKLGLAAGEEEFRFQFSQYGDDDGHVIWPTGIALDSEGSVYVTDEWLNRISIFDGDGTFREAWGAPGSGDGQLNRPAGIAVDSDDNLFIVDSLNHRVQRFSRDGGYLGQWGSHGSGDGELDSPWGIDVDHEGYVYVADHKNHRAQKFTPDGDYVAQFGSYGTGSGQLTRPSDVAVDPDGDVYVCDWPNDRVQIFGAEDGFFATLIGDAHQLSKWHSNIVEANADVIKARRRVYTLEPEWRFAYPTAVTFDTARSRLLVGDTHRGRIQIYNKLDDYMEPQFNL